MKSHSITLSNPFPNPQDKESYFRNHFMPGEVRLIVQSNQREEIVYGSKPSNTAFPTEVFPEKIQQIINETNSGLQFPVDFIGASILFASSVAIGNTFKVEVKKGWQESAVMYLAIVGRPGTNKTHPLRFALKPILEQDDRFYKEYQSKLEIFQNKKSSNSKESDNQEDPENVSKPNLKKFIISDITIEAVASVHKNNERGIGLYVDELAGWFKNFNRYNGGSEQEFWCSNWSGSPIIIDRKTTESIRINQPFISVCGTIQPGILEDMAKDNRGLNGFIDRILSVMPSGIKKERWSDREINTTIIETWDVIINRLMDRELTTNETGDITSIVLKFNPEAYKVLSHWQEYNTKLCNSTENELLSGLYTKLEVYCIRISLMLHLLKYACGDELEELISEDAVRGAIRLTEYFRTSADSVHSIIYESSPVDLLPGDKKRFYDDLPDIVKTGDANRKAEDYGFSERTVKRMLADVKLFRRIKQGVYEKLF